MLPGAAERHQREHLAGDLEHRRAIAERVVRAARALTAAGGAGLLAVTPLSGVRTLLGFRDAALGILRPLLRRCRGAPGRPGQPGCLDAQLLDHCLAAAACYASRPRGQVAAQKRILNESHSWTPEQSLAREAGTQLASVSSALFRRTVRRWLEMRDTAGGDTVFLTRPQPWLDGTATEMNP